MPNIYMDFDSLKTLSIDYMDSKRKDKFTAKRLYNELKAKYPDAIDVSYVTFIRVVDILIAEKKVHLEDFGFVRFVWRDYDNKQQR